MGWVQASHDVLWGLIADWVLLVGLFLPLGRLGQASGRPIEARQAGLTSADNPSAHDTVRENNA